MTDTQILYRAANTWFNKEEFDALNRTMARIDGLTISKMKLFNQVEVLKEELAELKEAIHAPR